MLQGLRARSDHNYARPWWLQLCGEMRGEGAIHERLIAEDALCNGRKRDLQKSVILPACDAPASQFPSLTDLLCPGLSLIDINSFHTFHMKDLCPPL